MKLVLVADGLNSFRAAPARLQSMAAPRPWELQAEEPQFVELTRFESSGDLTNAEG